jgi:ABC-type transporter Mla MlaB component
VIRIDAIDTLQGRVIRLEGNLELDAVQLLSAELARRAPNLEALTLDLSGLRSADDEGIVELHRLADHGVVLCGMSRFLDSMLRPG